MSVSDLPVPQIAYWEGHDEPFRAQRGLYEVAYWSWMYVGFVAEQTGRHPFIEYYSLGM